MSQRREIVTGTLEPTDEECEWHSDREEEEELAVSTPGIRLPLGCLRQRKKHVKMVKWKKRGLFQCRALLIELAEAMGVGHIG